MLLIGQSTVLKKMLNNGTAESSYDDTEFLSSARIYKKDLVEINSGSCLLSLSLFTCAHCYIIPSELEDSL
jgi:hypothetical protein